MAVCAGPSGGPGRSSLQPKYREVAAPLARMEGRDGALHSTPLRKRFREPQRKPRGAGCFPTWRASAIHKAHGSSHFLWAFPPSCTCLRLPGSGQGPGQRCRLSSPGLLPRAGQAEPVAYMQGQRGFSKSTSREVADARRDQGCHGSWFCSNLRRAGDAQGKPPTHRGHRKTIPWLLLAPS